MEHKFKVGDNVWTHEDWHLNPKGKIINGKIMEIVPYAGHQSPMYMVKFTEYEVAIPHQEHRLTALPTFFHQSDPAAPKDCHVWHYVYLHGEAEDHNAAQQNNNKWCDDPPPPDLFVADLPMPENGDHPVLLYGKVAVAVLRDRFNGAVRGGRVAFPDDAEGYAHATDPDKWG